MGKPLTKIKEHSKSITHSTVSDIIAGYFIKGAPTMIGFIAALSSYFRGLPLWLVILVGSLIFFLLSIAWDRIGGMYRKLKSKTEHESPAELQDVQPSMALIEGEVEKERVKNKEAIDILHINYGTRIDTLKDQQAQYESQTSTLKKDGN
jgi:hypothetical protein